MLTNDSFNFTIDKGTNLESDLSLITTDLLYFVDKTIPCPVVAWGYTGYFDVTKRRPTLQCYSWIQSTHRFRCTFLNGTLYLNKHTTIC